MTAEQISYIQGQIDDAQKLITKIDKLKTLQSFSNFGLRAESTDVPQPLANEIVTIGLSVYLAKAEESLSKVQIFTEQPIPQPVNS